MALACVSLLLLQTTVQTEIVLLLLSLIIIIDTEKKSQKVSDSHRNDVSPLTQGLRYRAACDD